MLAGNARDAFEIGDGAGDLENTVMGSGGKAHAADGHFEGALTGIVEGAKRADLGGGDIAVIETALALAFAGSLDAITHGGAGDAVVAATKFFIGDGRDFDMEVDSVEQGAADLAEIALNDGAGAAALTGGVAIEAAGAAVQISTATIGR